MGSRSAKFDPRRLVVPTLFDLAPPGTRRCPSCDARIIPAPPYRVGACIQQRWACDTCGAAGLDSTKAPTC
jgi:hypothetical protein